MRRRENQFEKERPPYNRPSPESSELAHFLFISAFDSERPEAQSPRLSAPQAHNDGERCFEHTSMPKCARCTESPGIRRRDCGGEDRDVRGTRPRRCQPLDGWEIRVSHVDYAPGRVGMAHQHQGFLFAYVLQGSVVAQVIGNGVSDEVRTYRTGEMFYEPIGSTHQVSKNASATEPARLLAINLLPKAAR